MPRKPRGALEGEHHHVVIKGHNGEPIVFRPQQARELLARLADAMEELSVLVFAWALLTNHMHLFLPGSIELVSRVMHRALGPYAQRLNLELQRTGRVFAHRFWSRPVEGSRDACNVEIYVLLNNRKAGIVRSIDELVVHEFCNLGTLLGRAPAVLPTDVEGALALLAPRSTSPGEI